MTHQPSAAELLQAVAEFLRLQAAPALGEVLAFHAKVAANMLDIVQRELQLGAAADAREAVGLQQLLQREGGRDALNTALCDALARGEMNAATPGLAAHLWQRTLDAMAVDQPGYAAYREALQANTPRG